MVKTVNPTPSYWKALLMTGCLFFIFGFVSWVNSILIPYFRIACDLKNEFQSYLVAFAFYIAYFVMTIPASIMLNRLGFKRGVKYGLWIMAVGAFLFTPAALTRTYGLFLLPLVFEVQRYSLLRKYYKPFYYLIINTITFFHIF